MCEPLAMLSCLGAGGLLCLFIYPFWCWDCGLEETTPPESLAEGTASETDVLAWKHFE